MLVLGLTGGVGMGKSLVAEFLASRGELIIDTDVVAREVVEPGTPALEEIQLEFGPGVIGPDGRLNRRELAREVFENEERRRVLERIVHPRIRRKWKERIEGWRREGKSRAIVVIPLLFETGAEAEFARTVCVACSTRVQMTRLERRGWTAEEAARRVTAQWPVEKKMERADAVIWNESSPEVCQEQAARIFA